MEITIKENSFKVWDMVKVFGKSIKGTAINMKEDI